MGPVRQVPPGVALHDLVSQQTFSFLLQRADELGIDPEGLDGLTIPACCFELAREAISRSDFDFVAGVDRTLRQWVEEDGKKPGFLEPPDSVHRTLGEMPLHTQERWLAFVLVDLPNLAPRVQAAERAWRNGDLEALSRVLLVEEMKRVLPEVRDALFVSRNRRWVDKLVQAMPFEAEVLVVVGAGHFFEPDGLLSLFAEHGYAFTQAGR